MATKISNGELKQENLLQDAMKFASTMPGLFGGANPGGGGNMQQKDMANMMNMMNTMMNNKEGMDAFKNMMGGADKGKKAGSKAAFNKNAYRKSMAANKLKAKLAKRREENQEVSDE